MPLVVPTQVRFFDLDGMGHVNNSVFLTYCELARMEFFRRSFKIENPTDFPFIIARAEVDYIRPLPLAVPTVDVELGVSRIGKKSWDFAYDIKDPETNQLFAQVTTIQVGYDYEANAAAELSGEMRAVLERDLAEYQKQLAGS